MTNQASAASGFHEGDEIVLAGGTYQGSTGRFLRLREDKGWADIAGPDGSVRGHPVVWLAHSAGPAQAGPELGARLPPAQ